MGPHLQTRWLHRVLAIWHFSDRTIEIQATCLCVVFWEQATGTQLVSGTGDRQRGRTSFRDPWPVISLGGWACWCQFPFPKKKLTPITPFVSVRFPIRTVPGRVASGDCSPGAPANSLFRTNRVEQQRQRPRRYSRYTS